MKLTEAIEIIENQAVEHPATACAPKEPLTKLKEWVKTITALDKSSSTGYSLIGEFWEKDKNLEPGLFLIFTLFSGQRIVQKQMYQRNNDGALLTDENGRFISKEESCPEYFEERRGILFDFDGNRVKLEHFTWLPRNRWAKKLWLPVKNWLEMQPNIPAKIEFWEAEVKLCTEALRQAEQRLNALKQQVATDTEELDPQTKQWLQTSAVLGTKKAAIAEATLGKTFY